MASHKKLNSGQLTNSTANIYDPNGVKGMVKTVVLHNTHTAAETAELYFNGTTDADRIIKAELASNETLEWSLGHMLLVEDSETLKGKSTTTQKVNFFIFGAEE